MHNLNILVTGGRGFIGTKLIELLEKEGFDTDCYDLKDGFDILNLKQLDEFMSEKKYDAVIHLAAKTSVEESHRISSEYIKTNSQGTKNVVDMAEKHGIGKIIYAATAASLIPDSSPYAKSKKEGEEYVKKFSGKYVILRLFNVVGRRNNPNYCGVIDCFRTGIKEGEITIYGDGNQTRDFIHIDDVCRAFILACQTDVSGVFEIGSGKKTSINELAKKMIGNKEIKVKHIAARKEVRDSIANTENAERYLRFTPQKDIGEFFE